MKRMVANQNFPYAGKPLSAGDSFEASDQDAHILSVVGRARYSEEQATDIGSRPKRKYRRRDMTAQ